MVNVPNYEQWDEMNDYLQSIAFSIGSNVDISTWEGIQKAVRLGLAPELLPIGTQLAVNHSAYGEHLYDVVAHDYFKSPKDETAHTMTLMCHDIIDIFQYDSPEAFYYANAELPAGTYCFTIESTYGSWGAGTYQFTLTKPLPAGGQLDVGGSSTTEITSSTVTSYANSTTTERMEMASITPGNGGTSLGTFGVELNHVHRVAYGSNNYKESAIRQFLNSSAATGSVWTPQTKFDRPPSWMKQTGGFIKGLDSDFLSVVGEVIVPCATNIIYESPDSTTHMGEKYTVIDKFYLASLTEITGGNTGVILKDDSIQFPYYKDATDADFIKYLNLSADRWMLRSPHVNNGNYCRIISAAGASAGTSPNITTVGCVPVCTIV